MLNSWFYSISIRSAGFSTIDIGNVQDGPLLVTMALMFIGGASGTTAGGIKVATFAVLLVAIFATILGRERPEIFGREIRRSDIDRALTIALVGLALVFITVLALSITEDAPFIVILFEGISAFATCGLSMGLTPDLSDPGRVIIILAMFIGRLGTLTLVLALVQRKRVERRRLAEEKVRIG